MNNSFARLQSGAAALSGLWNTVLRLDLVAAILAVNATFGSLRRGHGRVHRNLALAFQVALNIGDQLCMLLRREPLFLSHQVIFKSRNWIALAPVFEHRLRDIISRIMDGVAFHAHHFRLDQSRAFAAMSALHALPRGIVDLARIRAVHDYSGNSVCD